jgi:transcriptional regulator with XRE-family HTH domain
MSKQSAVDDGADLGEFITSAEMDRHLVATVPNYARLVDALVRRKRLLRAAARWREHHATQAAVAEGIGSRQPAVARLELGKVDPKLSTMERYAAALGANFMWQIVNDHGRPVSKDFTWRADVAFRESAPTVGAFDTSGATAEEVEAQVENGPLEEAIAEAQRKPGAVAEVARQLSEATVFVLGRRTERTATPGAYSDDDLVHDMFDVDGRQMYGLPVFTQLDQMIPALVQNRAWQSYSVLQIDGRELLENVGSHVTIVINPFAKRSFNFPQRSDRSLAYTAEPIVSAAQLVPA